MNGVGGLYSQKINRISENKKVIKIGTKARLVQPSSGFAFKRMHQDARRIAEGLKHEKIKLYIPNWFSRFTDRLMLKHFILYPDQTSRIFKKIISKAGYERLFYFLDGRFSLITLFKVFFALPWLRFIKLIFQKNLKTFRMNNAEEK